jgi:formylglycine-generating enzyme required for sulfatase activity
MDVNYGRPISFADGIFSTTEPEMPVVSVTWYGAAAFCDWLSLQAGLTRAYEHGSWSCGGGNPYGTSGFRLPSEAEWEYACRAGSTTEFSFGDCLDSDTEANFNGTDAFGTCPEGPYLAAAVDVGSYPANAWGLRDMHGNVWEWCQDWWATYEGDATNPTGPATGSEKVLRGGSWFMGEVYARSAFRYMLNATYDNQQVGFRVLRSAS